MPACRRSSSCTATGRVASSALPTFSTSAAPTPMSGWWIAWALASGGEPDDRVRCLVDDLIRWQFVVVGAGTRRKPGAGAHLGRGAGAAGGAGPARAHGRTGDVPGRGGRSDNPATHGDQLPFLPGYRGYLRPELVHVGAGGRSSCGAVRRRRASRRRLPRRREPERSGRGCCSARRHGVVAPRPPAPHGERRESDGIGKGFRRLGAAGSYAVRHARLRAHRRCRRGWPVFNPVRQGP